MEKSHTSAEAKPTRDAYGRRPVSKSRGKTHERILAMEHEPGRLPGAEHVQTDPPVGSISASLNEFNAAHVATKPVASRRAYERMLVLLLKDLEQNGPNPHEAIANLRGDRFAQHLDWRIVSGLDDTTELTRCAVQLGHLTEWLSEQGENALTLTRDQLRAKVAPSGSSD